MRIFYFIAHYYTVHPHTQRVCSSGVVLGLGYCSSLSRFGHHSTFTGIAGWGRASGDTGLVWNFGQAYPIGTA